MEVRNRLALVPHRVLVVPILHTNYQLTQLGSDLSFPLRRWVAALGTIQNCNFSFAGRTGSYYILHSC